MRVDEFTIPIPRYTLKALAEKHFYLPSKFQYEILFMIALSQLAMPVNASYGQTVSHNIPAPARIATQPAEQCDDPQLKSEAAAPHTAASSTVSTSSSVSGDTQPESPTVLSKARLKLPGLGDGRSSDKELPTQCTPDEEKATPSPEMTPVTPAVPSQKKSAITPLVTYSNGMLTVVAQDVPLKDILEAIHSETGAIVTFPPGNGNERVYGRFGPAPMRDAIISLLDGSGFNYVMLGSTSDSRLITQLLLTPRQNTTPSSTSEQVAIQAAPSRPGLYGQGYEADDTSSNEAAPVPVQAAQPTIPPAEASRLLKEAQELQQANPNMTRGQILAEMQKKHTQQLDDTAQSTPDVK
jgi:hypothetical protein